MYVLYIIVENQQQRQLVSHGQYSDSGNDDYGLDERGQDNIVVAVVEVVMA
jgi:hypothetical protein